MAITAEELKELAMLARESGDIALEEKALNQLIALQQPQPEPITAPQAADSFPGAGIIEPALAIASGAVAEPLAGLAGIAAGVIPGDEGAGARAVEATRQAIQLTPETPEGQANLEKLGGLVQAGIDLANYPISGLAGLVELVSGQGVEKAAETVRSIQEAGLSQRLGVRTFEETGSPAAAAIAETIPTAAGAALGVRGAQRLPQLDKAANEVSRALFKRQSPTKQRIARMLAEGSTDVETAKYKLMPDRAPQADDIQINLSGGEQLRLSGPGAKEGATNTTSKLKRFLNVGGPRVARDKLAAETIRQGFDEGVIASIKGASNIDKQKMLKMVDIMQRGKKNKRFAMTNRPSDVAGDSLMERIKTVRMVNRDAGSRLDGIANNLKGERVDFSPQVGRFLDDLGDIGVELDDMLKPIFANSDLEGLPGVQKTIKNVINRMTQTKVPDAYDIHRMKRFLDEQVTYGKSARGLGGRAESILKSFRADLDDLLDINFDEYNEVNTTYAETINALDSIQDVAGRKMDLAGGNADKAVGTLMRRIMSNAQSRVRLLDSIEDIESTAVKYGGRFGDDLLTQTLFVDELDAVFKPVARTSFQGQIDQAIQQTARATPKEAALSAVGQFAEKLRGINEESAFKSIKELLKERGGK